MPQKYVYWISTALLALLYTGGGVFYLISTAEVQAIWASLGFPPYLVPGAAAYVAQADRA